MPKISVIIPAYNAEVCIEKCLLSLKKQTFSDFEVIVVNDSSHDKTAEIASAYYRVIKSVRNLGEGAARNLGAKSAQGEILAFTDADVVLPNDWLMKILQDMETRKVKCVGGGYCGSLRDSFIEKFAFLELMYRRKNREGFVKTLVSNNFACHRDVFFEFGGFPEKFKCEDLRLSFLISKKYPIFWDKDNGVYHHFKSSLYEYLKQQYYFARDTVWTYYQYPEMLFSKTHQGTLIYFEIFFMFLALIASILFPIIGLLFLFSILLINYSFFLVLKKEKISIFRCVLVIFLRNFLCVMGILDGLWIVLRDLTTGLLRRRLLSC